MKINLGISRSHLKSGILHNILILFSGTSLSQVIPVLVSPILSRLFLPEDFGELSIFVSTYTILTAIACLRYDVAIVLPKLKRDADTLFLISQTFTILFSSVFFVIIFFLYGSITTSFGLSQKSLWLYFIPLAIIFNNFFRSGIYIYMREKNFKKIARSKVYQSIATALVSILYGLLLNGSGFGLILGKLGGLFQNSIYFFRNLKSILFSFHFINQKRALVLLKKYQKFPFFSVPNAFLNTLSVNMPIFLLTLYYDTSIAGYYGFAYRLVISPLNLIAQPIKDVYFQKIAEDYNNKKSIRAKLIKNYFNVLKVSAIPFILAFFLAPSLFAFIFGEKWLVAGKYVQVILPWLFMFFLNAPSTTIPAILNKQNVVLVYNIFLVIFRFLSIYIGFILFKDAYISLILFSAVGVIFNLIFIGIILTITKDKL